MEKKSNFHNRKMSEKVLDILISVAMVLVGIPLTIGGLGSLKMAHYKIWWPHSDFFDGATRLAFVSICILVHIPVFQQTQLLTLLMCAVVGIFLVYSLTFHGDWNFG